ncbi:unnamed protein product [Cylindrotheca closterium]|uniref:Uncharacterized protein n=1 Tax=Cylindrotheca closterium TaxID=2856 RepID=A0AAD2PXT1_9STRA|nr:unnamed protein product [Cylindrotheca closterium]
MMIGPMDDMLDDMMSSDEEEEDQLDSSLDFDDDDDHSYNDYDEPTFGSDEEEDYSTGCLSTIWEDEEPPENETVNGTIDTSGRTGNALLAFQNSKNNLSFLNDSANRDLWRSSSSFTSPVSTMWEDGLSLEGSDRRENKPTRRWSSEMSFGSLNSDNSGNAGNGNAAMRRGSGGHNRRGSGGFNNYEADNKDGTPKMCYRRMSMGARSQSDSSLGSNNTNNSISEHKSNITADKKDGTPKMCYRRMSMGARSQSDSSLGSNNSVTEHRSNITSDSMKDGAPQMTFRRMSMGARSQSDSSLGSNNSVTEHKSNTTDKIMKSLMEETYGCETSDALIAQMVNAYFTGEKVQMVVDSLANSNKDGEPDVGILEVTPTSMRQSRGARPRLSLDSYLAATPTRTTRSNQLPPGKPRRQLSPIRRRSMDSLDSGVTGVSGDSLLERIQTKPNANAFNADETPEKIKDTPPVNPTDAVRKRPPGIPVRQRSLASMNTEGDDDDSDASIDDSFGDESSAGASTAGPTSFRFSKRGSLLSACSSTGTMTIEEGDEDDCSSSDDETLDSNAESESVGHTIPPPRQYFAPLKGGGGGATTSSVEESVEDSDLEDDEDESLPSRQYLAPLKGGPTDEIDDGGVAPPREYLVPLSMGHQEHEEEDEEEEEREYLVSTKGDELEESPVVVEETQPQQDEDVDSEVDSEGPMVVGLEGLSDPSTIIPEITTISLPPEDERVDAKLILEKHLLEEQAPQSPRTLERKRSGSSHKRKIKYDMARCAITPKIDMLLSPVGTHSNKNKVAPDSMTFPPSVVEKSNMMDISDRTLPPAPEEPEDSDPILSPLQKKIPRRTSSNSSNKDTIDKRIRIRSKMQHVEDRLANIRSLMDEPSSEEDIEKDFESSSTQLTDATSAYLTDGSSEMEMLVPLSMMTNSTHSSRSRSRHVSMAGMVDETVPGPPMRSPRSPNSPLQHPTPCGPTIMEDAATTSGSGPSSLVKEFTSNSGRKARTALTKGFQRSRQRLQSLLRPNSSSHSAAESWSVGSSSSNSFSVQ